MKKVAAVREPVATWWKIGSYKAELVPFKIIAFTDMYVTYLGTEWRLSGPDAPVERRARRDDFFPTFAEAKAEAIRRAEASVESAKRGLQDRRSLLGQFESLQESEGKSS